MEDSLSGTEEYSDVLEKQNKKLIDALRILADIGNWKIHSNGITFDYPGGMPWEVASRAIEEGIKLKWNIS